MDSTGRMTSFFSVPKQAKFWKVPEKIVPPYFTRNEYGQAEISHIHVVLFISGISLKYPRDRN